MNRKLNTIFFLTVTLILPSITYGQTEVQNRESRYTLEECISLSVENYPAIRRYDLIERAREYNLKIVSLDNLPKVNFMLKGSYQSDVTQIPISIPGNPITPLSKDQYSATVNIEQKIWDGGLSQASRREIQTKSELEVNELKSEIYSIRERVMNLFLGITLIEKQLDINNLHLHETERIKNKVKSLALLGYATPNDTLVVEAEEVTLRQRRALLYAERLSYSQILSRMTGVEIDSSTILIAPLGDMPADLTVKRVELSLFESMKKIAEIRYDYINSRDLPKIWAYLQTGYGRPALNMLNNSFDPFYLAGIRVIWDIKGFNTRKVERQIIENSIRSIDNRRDLFIYNVDLNRISAMNKIENIKELLKGDIKLAKIRESILNDSSIKLEEGVISVTEHLREMNLLEIARYNLSKREVELLMAVEELKYIINQ